MRTAIVAFVCCILLIAGARAQSEEEVIAEQLRAYGVSFISFGVVAMTSY
jgi:hypothetical protein